MEVRLRAEGAASSSSYLAAVMHIRRRLGQGLVLLAVGLAIAGCGTEPEGFAARSGTARTWAPLPEEVPMPSAAPHDPKAYRGVCYRMVHQPGGPGSVEVDGRPAPWLQSSAWAYTTVGGLDGPYFGEQQIFDGHRRMVWFFRLVEPPVPVYNPNPPPQPPLATTAPPPRPGSTGPWATAGSPPPPPPPPPPPEAVAAVPHPPDPPRAVLDVLVLPDGPPGSGFEWGCGPDPVVIVGDDGRRLNRTTGRIEPTNPDKPACPDKD